MIIKVFIFEPFELGKKKKKDKKKKGGTLRRFSKESQIGIHQYYVSWGAIAANQYTQHESKISCGNRDNCETGSMAKINRVISEKISSQLSPEAFLIQKYIPNTKTIDSFDATDLDKISGGILECFSLSEYAAECQDTALLELALAHQTPEEQRQNTAAIDISIKHKNWHQFFMLWQMGNRPSIRMKVEAERTLGQDSFDEIIARFLITGDETLLRSKIAESPLAFKAYINHKNFPAQKELVAVLNQYQALTQFEEAFNKKDFAEAIKIIIHELTAGNANIINETSNLKRLNKPAGFEQQSAVLYLLTRQADINTLNIFLEEADIAVLYKMAADIDLKHNKLIENKDKLAVAKKIKTLKNVFESFLDNLKNSGTLYIEMYLGSRAHVSDFKKSCFKRMLSYWLLNTEYSNKAQYLQILINHQKAWSLVLELTPKIDDPELLGLITSQMEVAQVTQSKEETRSLLSATINTVAQSTSAALPTTSKQVNSFFPKVVVQAADSTAGSPPLPWHTCFGKNKDGAFTWKTSQATQATDEKTALNTLLEKEIGPTDTIVLLQATTAPADKTTIKISEQTAEYSTAFYAVLSNNPTLLDFALETALTATPANSEEALKNELQQVISFAKAINSPLLNILYDFYSTFKKFKNYQAFKQLRQEVRTLISLGTFESILNTLSQNIEDADSVLTNYLLTLRDIKIVLPGEDRASVFPTLLDFLFVHGEEKVVAKLTKQADAMCLLEVALYLSSDENIAKGIDQALDFNAKPFKEMSDTDAEQAIINAFGRDLVDDNELQEFYKTRCVEKFSEEQKVFIALAKEDVEALQEINSGTVKFVLDKFNNMKLPEETQAVIEKYNTWQQRQKPSSVSETFQPARGELSCADSLPSTSSTPA